MKEKTFYKFLVEFSLNPAKAKQGLVDKRLKQTEKLILEGYLKLRNNLNHEVVKLLQPIQPSDLAFVESQRLLIMACAYNNQSHFKLAEECFLNSIQLLEKLETPYFHFMA